MKSCDLMKKCFALLGIFFLFFAVQNETFAASPLPQLEKPVYIQDHLDVFSSSEKDTLNQRSETLKNGTTSEILLMLMPTIGQENRQDYALRAGREYGVGDTKKENGIVILLNLDNGNEYRNRGIAVAVGYGLEGVLNDAKVGQLIDQYALEDMKEAIAIDPKGKDPLSKQYINKAVTKLYNAIVDEVNKAYGFDGKTYKQKEPQQQSEGFSIFEIIIAIFFVYLIISIFFNNGGRGNGGRRGGSGPIIFFPTGGGFSSGGFSSGSSGGSFGDSFGDSFGAGGGFGGGGADRGF